MTFFNRKEEVIEIKLTPYGRLELAKGNFIPEFYAFYDADILYDGDYGGLIGENQNHIESRIKETPRIHIQPTRTRAPSVTSTTTPRTTSSTAPRRGSPARTASKPSPLLFALRRIQ